MGRAPNSESNRRRFSSDMYIDGIPATSWFSFVAASLSPASRFFNAFLTAFANLPTFAIIPSRAVFSCCQ